MITKNEFRTKNMRDGQSPSRIQVFVNEWMVRQYLSDPQFADCFQPIAAIPGLFWEPDNYVAAAVRACRNAAGELLAIPVNVSPVVACYNLDYSRRPAIFPGDHTFAEFICFLKKNQEWGAGYRSYPFILSAGLNRWPIFVRSFGGELFSPDGTSCLLNSPAALRAIEFLAELAHVKHLCCLPMLSNLSLDDLLEQGHFLTTWITKIFLQRPHALRFGFAPLPHEQRRTTHLRLDAMLVPRTTKMLPIVRDWLHFLCMPENQLFFSERAEAFSCHRKVGEFFCAQMAKRHPGFEVFFKELEFAEPVVAAPRQAVMEYVRSRLQLVWLGVESPAKACRIIAVPSRKKDKMINSFVLFLGCVICLLSDVKICASLSIFSKTDNTIFRVSTLA